jgi:hypothetical protein
MWELRVLELLAAFFLFLPLIRPFAKTLSAMDGLALLPLFALGICVGFFPAYGIRPEALPLIAYAVFLNFLNLPALGALVKQLGNGGFRERGAMSTGMLLALLIVVTALAMWFAPTLDVDLTESGVRSAQVRDPDRDAALFLRIYGPDVPPMEEAELAKRPLLVLIPPAEGSLRAVDRLCVELSLRGFTVLAYSRKGIDAPAIRDDGAKRILSPARHIRLLRAIFQGTRWAGANRLGRALEEERRLDLAFLLSSLQNRGGIGNLLDEGTDRDLVFVAGFGAGGAAAITLASEAGFAGRNPAVRGIVGLESPVLSALKLEPPQTLAISKAETGRLQLIVADLRVRLANLAPRKLTGVDSPPLPEVPALYVLSDRALQTRHRERRYQSVLESFRRGTSPAALAMAPGAGPLDYSDVPEKYPLLSLLFPGSAAPIWGREDYLPGIAALIANFCSAAAKTAPIRRAPLGGNVSVDTNRAWNLAATEYILGL